MLITLPPLAVVFHHLMMVLRSLMRSLQSMVMTLQSLLRVPRRPVMTLLLDDAPAVVGDLSSRKGHSRAAVVCPGSAHVGAPSRQQCLAQTCRYCVVAGLAAWGLSRNPSAPGSAHRLGSAP